jgi:transposase
MLNWQLQSPSSRPARPGGRKRSVNVREVLNGILYVLWTACQWKAVPKDPCRRRARCTTLYVAVREQDGREASPPIPALPMVLKNGSSLDPSGYDACKKIKGRKRHILVDTLGLLLSVVVHPADIQDRDGSFHLLRRARRLLPLIERIFAVGDYRSEEMACVVSSTGV